MNIVLFGATGTVGTGVLLECLADARVRSVLVVTRSSTGRRHTKLREVIHSDFFRYDDLAADFADCDACFFCLGVSSVGMNETEYTRQTYDLTLAAARTMVAANPRMIFCYMSGVGTDSSEAWQDDVGAGEREDGERAARTAVRGCLYVSAWVHSADGWSEIQDRLGPSGVHGVGACDPLLRPLLRGTTTVNFGRALIEAAGNGYSKRILYSSDINALAENG